jgi:aspartate kinase
MVEELLVRCAGANWSCSTRLLELDIFRGFQVIDEISSRSKDSVIGLGEKLACKLMAAVLRDQVYMHVAVLLSILQISWIDSQGMEAEYVSLEDIVPSSHLTDDSDLSVGAIGLEQPFYDELAKAIAQRIDQCGSRIPVVTGTLYYNPSA